jgi:hypothetical protein
VVRFDRNEAKQRFDVLLSKKQPLEFLNMPMSAEELKEIKAKSTAEYNHYAQTQQGVEQPKSTIKIDESDSSRTEVHIRASHKGINYNIDSMKPEDAKEVYDYLNNQPLVRQKYANGKTLTPEDNQKRVNQLSRSFEPNAPEAQGRYMYGGFMVRDADTNQLLGVENLGGSATPGHSEMAYLNRPEAWSSATPEIVKEYVVDEKDKLNKVYAGVATVEVSTLLQYASFLKEKGYKIHGEELQAVVATARLDNFGSWKACAKSPGMEVTDIDANENYGPELRYQLCKKL